MTSFEKIIMLSGAVSALSANPMNGVQSKQVAELLVVACQEMMADNSPSKQSKPKRK